MLITVVTAMDGSDGDAGKGREGELTSYQYSSLVVAIVLGGKMMEIHLMILHIDLLEMLTKDGYIAA